ncbi:iron-containing redox enzyme family protein [Paraburkholderia diazotrophica]|uniref:Iron-containing redox enzyme n=1 Tax=Paraburkholderia diazotrophica TaxID=667676 RepID=A0A1H7E115_9BURK|nr:iron-containing redox enzyme family protein [Paraburkholderia diazotrophica]SEK07689.1 hypothetical protein SAMN05192539_103932 [Paraburkholderia diazotrophica]
MQATTASDLFSAPRFRPGVQLIQEHNGLTIDYREQSCSVVADMQGSLQAFADSLKLGDATIAELKRRHADLSPEIDGLIEEFDRLGLLTESAFPAPRGCLSGEEFYHRIRKFAAETIERKSKSRFYQGLRDRTLPRSALIGYALEYFYIVREAPGLIAPALGHAEPVKVQKLLQGFLASELNHDEMLRQSLHAVSIRTDNLDYLVPLPATFALCASLGVYARQHPLSFKALLFLFEQPGVSFHVELADYCRETGIPEGFWRPIARHASINDEFDHDDISLTLLSGIDAVSPEEQLTVKKHVMLAIETMVLQENQIFNYYGRQPVVKPRIFA